MAVAAAAAAALVVAAAATVAAATPVAGSVDCNWKRLWFGRSDQSGDFWGGCYANDSTAKLEEK